MTRRSISTSAVYLRLLLGAALVWPLGASALGVKSVSPQGESVQPAQVRVVFDEPAVKFGDSAAAAPFTVQCAPAQGGSSRWLNEREWVWQFRGELSAGVRCSIKPRAEFKGPQGQAVTGAAPFGFSTGGPTVVDQRPYSGSSIDEDQHFLLTLSGPADLTTVQSQAYCVAEGVGERIPVRLIDGAERAAMLQADRLTQAATKAPLTYVTLACKRRFAPEARVQIVWGKGIRTPGGPNSPGVPTVQDQRLRYHVRKAFTASLQCERENANAGCVPLRPITLYFSAPVPSELAQAITLSDGQQSLKPDGRAGERGLADSVTFRQGLRENTAYRVVLPAKFADAAGRSLSNAADFPMNAATGRTPPLVKFSAAPFGIIERFANGTPGRGKPQEPALLPVTLRGVEPELVANTRSLTVQDATPQGDAEVLRWLGRVETAHEMGYDKRHVALLGQGGPSTQQLQIPLGENTKNDSKVSNTREGNAAVSFRPFEVVGIPLKPGFHVVEIASPLLGQALLDPKLGPQRRMVVRTAALVTNLGVHFKLGREGSLAWVTTLDGGKPVAGAKVNVLHCDGRVLAQGTTGPDGTVAINGLSPEEPFCARDERVNGHEIRTSISGYFVAAHHTADDGVADMAFTLSSWNRGIESWRFNLPMSRDTKPDLRLHTVLDRTLLRQGETVSMKHFARAENGQGLGLPGNLPTELKLVFTGDGSTVAIPVTWRKTPSGGLSAESQWKIPPAARLGEYRIEFDGKGMGYADTAHFRVSAFRLPVISGSVRPVAKGPLVALTQLPVDVSLQYLSGGPAAKLPVQVSALVQADSVPFGDDDSRWAAFSFRPPQKAGDRQGPGDDEELDEVGSRGDQRVVADKLPLTLDAKGRGQVTLPKLPTSREPQRLVIETSYLDPNGERQTLRHTDMLWPAAVLPGIRTGGWASSGAQVSFQAAAVGTDGKPAADVPLKVRAVAHITTTSRKRLVGGFYAYDHHTELKNLGEVCSGKSDARGLLLCSATLKEAGEIELIATATDSAGRSAEAADTVWVTRQGELWFAQDNHDRMDVLPEVRELNPGDTARLQVRMPFRHATALVTVEREGILHREVVELHSTDPTISLKVDGAWGPNVYVSVLALRGRLIEVPWYSFFTWGWQSPREWWRKFWVDGREYTAPTPLVDLSKPTYRLGVAELKVGLKAHQIAVKLTPDHDRYKPRDTARVQVSATLPNGQPAAGAEVALAAVDQALLELMPNPTWDALNALYPRRSWGVETSTAQMEIVGRRHYGRKALPAGGGGGRSPTRELFDTLLTWQPRVVLDAQGKATVNVKLNDSLTSFRLVAVADHGTAAFGTGSATIRSQQDLQAISGLPPLVREGDRFDATLTLRNTTDKAMKVTVSPSLTLDGATDKLPKLKQTIVDVPGQSSQIVTWSVALPDDLLPSSAANANSHALTWTIAAKDANSTAEDKLQVTQRVDAAVPVAVQQASLLQIDGRESLNIAPPAGALPGRGGVSLAFQPKLTDGLPGVRDWFTRYPHTCLEQQASRSLGLDDRMAWAKLMGELPTYLDRDGLANYFPDPTGRANGSDALTAYLLTMSHEMGQRDAATAAAFAIPSAERERMLRGLTAFVEGRVERRTWAPLRDLDARKLTALVALARHGKALPRHLESISVNLSTWPTHSLLDWAELMQRVKGVDGATTKLAEANAQLRSRLSAQGTQIAFTTERSDRWWSLMTGPDGNAARLLLHAMTSADWAADRARLVTGLLARQQRGAWDTTTANLWGQFAVQRFAQLSEATPVDGRTVAALGVGKAEVKWADVTAKASAASSPASSTAQGPGAAPDAATVRAPGGMPVQTALLPWASGVLSMEHIGRGKPWVTVQSLAAIPRSTPRWAGYEITRRVSAVEQVKPGQFSRGDVLRVTLDIQASADMTWVALTDPLPAGATLLGSGLLRDSLIDQQRPAMGASAPRPSDENQGTPPTFQERGFDALRSYWAYLPAGKTRLSYTVRLNNAGDFQLPATRVEAMYAPDMFGELPNAAVKVVAP